jgi:hypothetical protein
MGAPPLRMTMGLCPSTPLRVTRWTAQHENLNVKLMGLDYN